MSTPTSVQTSVHMHPHVRGSTLRKAAIAWHVYTHVYAYACTYAYMGCLYSVHVRPVARAGPLASRMAGNQLSSAATVRMPPAHTHMRARTHITCEHTCTCLCVGGTPTHQCMHTHRLGGPGLWLLSPYHMHSCTHAWDGHIPSRGAMWYRRTTRCAGNGQACRAAPSATCQVATEEKRRSTRSV